MDELKELCDRAAPEIVLNPEWEELPAASQMLRENGYIQDSEDVNLFVKDDLPSRVHSAALTEIGAPAGPEKVILPEATELHYKPRPRGSDEQRSDLEWKFCRCIQLDTSKLPPHDQVRIRAKVPNRDDLSREQKVGIRLVIQPLVKADAANLYVHMQIESVSVGVLKTDVLSNEVSVGYYPGFISITLQPQLEGYDPQLVAIPVFTKAGNVLEQEAGSIVRTTQTKLGGQIGWGPFTLSAERSWGTEFEESRETHKLVPVVTDEGNAASFEWRILRWGNGAKYRPRKPHSGLSVFGKTVKAPLGQTIATVQGFPGILWRLPPKLMNKVMFRMQLQVEMHLLWFVGKSPFFRVPGFESVGFQYINEFPVTMH